MLQARLKLAGEPRAWRGRSKPGRPYFAPPMPHGRARACISWETPREDEDRGVALDGILTEREW